MATREEARTSGPTGPFSSTYPDDEIQESYVGKYGRWEADSMVVGVGATGDELFVLLSEVNEGPIELLLDREGTSRLKRDEYPELFETLPDETGLFVWDGRVRVPLDVDRRISFSSKGEWRKATEADVGHWLAARDPESPVSLRTADLQSEIRALRRAVLIAANRLTPLPAFVMGEDKLLAFFLAQAKAELTTGHP